MKFSSLIMTTLFGLCATLQAESQFVYFGTSGKDAKGIYVSRLDAATGKLSPATLACEAKSPGFLAIHPTGKFLYTVAPTIPDHDAKQTGGVSAYAIDAKTGRLTLLNQQPSGGRGPCHVSLADNGQVLLVANYNSGSCASLAINPDGSLQPPASSAQHTGSSVNPSRQKGPHAHSVNPGPNDRYAFVADLGTDKVVIYQLDARTAKITPHATVAVPAGSGPRHFAFHPNGKWAYTNGELLLNVTGFRFAADKGSLTPFQTIATLPEETDLTGMSTAEIQVHRSGKFLYVSNRGHDSITVFAINPANGTLTLIERTSIEGKTPRNFGIDPTGNFLLAAGQNSASISVFRIDPSSGKLTFSGEKISVPAPICVKFLAAE